MFAAECILSIKNRHRGDCEMLYAPDKCTIRATLLGGQRVTFKNVKGKFCLKLRDIVATKPFVVYISGQTWPIFPYSRNIYTGVIVYDQ